MCYAMLLFLVLANDPETNQPVQALHLEHGIVESADWPAIVKRAADTNALVWAECPSIV